MLLKLNYAYKEIYAGYPPKQFNTSAPKTNQNTRH